MGFLKRKKSEATPESQKSQRDDKENIESIFLELLNELNVDGSLRKEMMNWDPKQKKLLIRQNRQKQKQSSKKKIKMTPRYFIHALKTEPSIQLVKDLRSCLNTEGGTWLKNFVQLDGVSCLVVILSGCNKFLCTFNKQQRKIAAEAKKAETKKKTKKKKKEKEVTLDISPLEQEKRTCQHLVREIILTLRSMMNNPVALSSVFSTDDSINQIALCLLTDDLKIYPTIYELLAAVSMVPPLGHRLVLKAMDFVQKNIRAKNRFVFLSTLLMSNLKDVEQIVDSYGLADIKISALTFMNALVNAPDDLQERVNIRNELLDLGILKYLKREKGVNEKIDQQRELFEDLMVNDNFELQEQFSDVDSTNPLKLTEALVRICGKGNNSFVSFLNILRNLYRVATATTTSNPESLWNLIDDTLATLVHKEIDGIEGENSISSKKRDFAELFPQTTPPSSSQGGILHIFSMLRKTASQPNFISYIDEQFGIVPPETKKETQNEFTLLVEVENERQCLKKKLHQVEEEMETLKQSHTIHLDDDASPPLPPDEENEDRVKSSLLSSQALELPPTPPEELSDLESDEELPPPPPEDEELPR